MFFSGGKDTKMKNDKLLDTIQELLGLGFDLDGLLDNCSIEPLCRIVDSCHKSTRVMAIAAYLLAKKNATVNSSWFVLSDGS